MFMKSVVASAQFKNAWLLCELLGVSIREVGLQYVVQVIKGNATDFVGRMIMERHPNLFWTPCVAHWIDLMLEDIGKILFVKDIVE